jgi:hypothetical protein
LEKLFLKKLYLLHLKTTIFAIAKTQKSFILLSASSVYQIIKTKNVSARQTISVVKVSQLITRKNISLKRRNFITYNKLCLYFKPETKMAGTTSRSSLLKISSLVTFFLMITSPTNVQGKDK